MYTQEVKVQEPTGGLYEYGLVQNVMFDHFEAQFSDGDMLVPMVGPYLDVWPKQGVPFMHEGIDNNPVFPTSAGYMMLIAPSFTDKPSWPLPTFYTYCGHAVKLRTASRSMAFRVGLVARNYQSKELTQLGVLDSMYFIKWRVEIDHHAEKRSLVSDNRMAGTFTLVSSGRSLSLAPPTAVTIVNTIYRAEQEAMALRCSPIMSDMNDSDTQKKEP